MSRFSYGAEYQRLRQEKSSGRIIYAGGQEVEVINNGQTSVTTIKTYWPMGLGVEIDKSNSGSWALFPSADLALKYRVFW